MNTVTIHPQPRKPLTFADIKAGPFVFEGNDCTKFNAATANGWNAVRHHDGELLAMYRGAVVTLPDATPPQGDTVPYGTIDPGEMFEDPDCGSVFMVSDQQSPHGPLWCHDFSDGRRAWFRDNYRVRRLNPGDSVTITQGSETK